MKEVITGLFVGNQKDVENYVFAGPWAFCLAAKEPWHRAHLLYTGRACAKDHPEYLWAVTEDKIILNLVDAPKAEFFDKKIIDAALEFIEKQLLLQKRVVIACNQGESRSPSIALLFLIKEGVISGETFEDCEAEFMKLYPDYNPNDGIRGFCKLNWKSYLEV